MDIQWRDRSVRVPSTDIDRVERAVFRGERMKLRVGVVVTGDREIRRINRRWLGHDWSTDVIAFDLRDSDRRPVPGEVDGEIVINAQRARREARRRKHPARAELLFYVAHGLLHLLGYDDDTPGRRARMHGLQARYLARAGIPWDG